MNRRHFIKLTSAVSVATLSSRISSAGSAGSLAMNTPDQAWALRNGQWIRLIAGNGNTFRSNDIVVTIRPNGNAAGIYVASPEGPLEAIRLSWKYNLKPAATFLGDHFERSYGDLAWKQQPDTAIQPWYILIHDAKQTACFGVKTGANSLCWWNLQKDRLELTLDTHSGGNGVLLGNRTLHAADVVTMQSRANENPFRADQRFCGIMCEKPKLPQQPVYGINDWYFAYGKNDFELIKQTTGSMAELVTNTKNKPFSVIDAGWAEYSPLLPGDGSWNEDFGRPNPKFRDMQLMGDTIKQLGMRPGLWMRPLCARHDEKASLLAHKIPGRTNPKMPVLDPTIPENLERIKQYFTVYKNWGFELVKHDFTTYDIAGRWGFSMKNGLTSPDWHFYDTSKTNAEIILQLYQTIRQAAGDGIYVIGCNTMSHLSAGLFDICRTGDDTSGKDWSRTLKMGVNTLAFRLPHHNRFYAVDGDCVGLTTQIPWEKNRQWLQLLAESGSPLFISAEPQAMGQAQKAAVKQAFAQASRPQPTGEPIDWQTNLQPSKWKLNGRIVDFQWT
nr:hypothetical protein [uncultured Arsenicibacter sp.]